MRIAFVGKMRAGKDTCAEYLLGKYSGNVYKFADRLYEMQEKLYEMAELPYPAGTKNRKLLQFLGTDFARSIDPDIWVSILERKLTHLIKVEEIRKTSYLFDDFPSHNMFCTDARFVNEVEMLKRLGFSIIYIDRPLEERLRFGASDLTHASETSLDHLLPEDYDGYINNNSSLEHLRFCADAIYDSVLARSIAS